MIKGKFVATIEIDIVIHNDGNLENLRNKAVQFLLNEKI